MRRTEDPTDDDDVKYNEMMKPLTYRSDDDRKYKYRHNDIILRSKYKALKGRVNIMKRLNLFDKYTKDDHKKHGILHVEPDANKLSSPRDLISLYGDIGMFSVISEDTSGGALSERRWKDAEIFVRNLPEMRPSIDGALRDYSNHRLKMWNLNLKDEELNKQRAQRRHKNIQVSQAELNKQPLGNEREIQTVYPISRLDSFDLTSTREGSEVQKQTSKPKLALQSGLDKIYVAEMDFLDGFDRLGLQDCQKTLDEVYLKPDEEIISSFYALKSEIPSVQLTKCITIRIPAKIRFDSSKLKYSIRMKIGLVWRRIDAEFEEIPGTSIFEGYVAFKTEIRGAFFATCDFLQFTHRVDKYGFNFRNHLIPDMFVALKGTAMEEPEEVSFQIRLIDRKRFSKLEDISPRLIHPITYVTDGLYIHRNKMLYSKRVSPMIVNISNDIVYETGSDVYLVREKDSRINILGRRTSTDKKFTAMLDNSHSTFWFVVTKQINRFKQYEPIIERAFAVSSERLMVCRILTFHENKKEEFNIWVCIVEQPDVDEVINKYLNLYGTSEKRLEMTEEGGVSHVIDFKQNTPDVTIDLDINFKPKQYKELPTLRFQVGRSCRAKFRVPVRINPYLCDEDEKFGMIRYYLGSKMIHEVKIDTAAPIPQYDEPEKVVAPEFSKEALEKILSAESLHNLAQCLSEGEGFELAIRLGVPADKVSKVLLMYGSIESKTFRLMLIWKSNIQDTIPDVKDFIEAFYDIDRGDLAHGIMDALDKCQVFKK